MVTVLLLSPVDSEKIIHEVRWPFRSPCGCAGVMQSALPDKARPGLHAEPLNVAIGQLLAPYFPSTSAMVIDGSNTTNTINKNLLASD